MLTKMKNKSRPWHLKSQLTNKSSSHSRKSMLLVSSVNMNNKSTDYSHNGTSKRVSRYAKWSSREKEKESRRRTKKSVRSIVESRT